MRATPTFVVLDGLVSAEEFAPSPRDFKKFIHELQTISGMTGCTMRDAVVDRARGRVPPRAHDGRRADRARRHRGRRAVAAPRRWSARCAARGSCAAATRSRSRNAGIRIRPRIETLLRSPDEDDPAPRAIEHADFGVVGLDAMLRGGLPGGSNTIVLGPSGSGKTMLGLQFLSAGARHDDVGLYVGFYERPASLLAKGKRLGLGLARRDASAGLLHLFWEAPIEGVLDAVVERVLRAVDRSAASSGCASTGCTDSAITPSIPSARAPCSRRSPTS